MNKKQPLTTIDKAILDLNLNTTTRRRRKNLIEIAKNIRWLEKELGGLKNVAASVNISVQMLKRFLSVEGLSDEVRDLVKKRKLDSVTLIHLIKDLNYSDQKIIAKHVIEGNITIDNVKLIVPLAKKRNKEPIENIISEIIRSRDINIFIIKIPVNDKGISENKIRNKLGKMIGSDNIENVKIESDAGYIELKKAGLQKLRQIAGSKHKLRQLIFALIRN